MKILCLIVLSITLMMPLAQADAAVTVESKQYKQDIYDVSYPRFGNLENAIVEESINSEIEEYVSRFLADVRNQPEMRYAIMKYEVCYQSDNLISFTLLTGTYAGGAHGSAVLKGFTYDLDTGRRCEFRDLYSYGELDRLAIDAQIVQRLRTEKIPIFEPYKGVKDVPDFFVDSHGVPVIFFQQYEIGPYVIGIQKFPVKVNKLL